MIQKKAPSVAKWLNYIITIIGVDKVHTLKYLKVLKVETPALEMAILVPKVPKRPLEVSKSVESSPKRFNKTDVI